MDVVFFMTCSSLFLFFAIGGLLYMQIVGYISILLFGKPTLEYGNNNYANNNSDNGDYLVYSAMYLSMEE